MGVLNFIIRLQGTVLSPTQRTGGADPILFSAALGRDGGRTFQAFLPDQQDVLDAIALAEGLV